ncbi:hypothetical protein AAF712_011062 [Marasmius tenuissimus]|uniref:DDE Tnp4 domain-containing protein n=1 Tax=Marasmius tenuissimus TaxID=585030 RepID=A0ABR2ZLL7_9AGAR|nr:hypothetical protein PM082_023850 [Marasmius tenuissimus]
MYAHRYQVPRIPLEKNNKPQLCHVLDVEKHLYPNKFRESIRLSPTTFDKFVAVIKSNPAFHNNSDNQQLPVDEQAAVVLYRFGHHGNAASLQKVTDWAGWGKGTVLLVTRRVMAVILRPAFMNAHVQMPSPSEKEEAKQWVEGRSCEAWRNRKCNYSLNVQAVSLPNLQIVDFTVGFTGSTHDSTAWEYTRLKKEHLVIVEDGEWVWADSAYPIEWWVVAPYKSPYREIPENAQFNNYVSMVIGLPLVLQYKTSPWLMSVMQVMTLMMIHLFLKACMAPVPKKRSYLDNVITQQQIQANRNENYYTYYTKSL